MGARVVGFIAFDTLNFAAQLENSGFTREQAVALAKAEAEILTGLLEEKLVTKSDLKQETQLIRSEIQEFRSELKQEMQAVRSELKQEIQAVRSELKQEIQAVRSELKQDIQELKVDVMTAINHQTRWLIGVMISSFGLLGILMTVFKFVR